MLFATALVSPFPANPANLSNRLWYCFNAQKTWAKSETKNIMVPNARDTIAVMSKEVCRFMTFCRLKFAAFTVTYLLLE